MVTVFPTGTTIYKPDKCWNGLTIFATGALIDMNGNVLNKWDLFHPVKILPGGSVMGIVRGSEIRNERGRKVVQQDWEGNTKWEFRKTEKITIDGKEIWSAKTHHDFEREGNPVGYYAPDMEPKSEDAKTLILASKETEDPDIAPGKLLDDCILEVNWNGEITWEWRSCEHFDEMGLDEAARNIIYRGAVLNNDYDGVHSTGRSREPYDWLHSNSISYLGPNKWYDEGDDRFHPRNIIWDARHTNTIAIIDKETKEFVWRIGPDYSKQELKKIRQIIGQHHAHMIPKGLPGAGNILVFDNGGYGGYDSPNPSAPTGENDAVRPYSRVIEFNPVTMEVEWEYSAKEIGYDWHRHDRFYSPFISSAQRLPNGNTLICEGDRGKIFEVTPELEIVWEYVVPPEIAGRDGLGYSYRAYRVPYEWVPQVENPKEKPVIPPKPSEFQIEPD